MEAELLAETDTCLPPQSLAGRRLCVAGATGTIGRAVVRECAARGADVVALVRDVGAAGELDTRANVRLAELDLTNETSLTQALQTAQPHTVISCIASRSGAPRDAQAVDYEANSRLLSYAMAAGAEHFIILSAICVQRPHLAFQHAKLRFEAELQAAAIDHTIVRPTAFFKSLSGQIDRVEKGKPFLIFGDGELTRCKPISDADLARFIADCASDPEARGHILPIGGPGPAISLKEQGKLLFEIAGREPQFRSVSPRLFDMAARVLSLGAPLSGWFAEKAEYARIAKYYATQSMLLLDPASGEYNAEATPEYGSDTLRDHYAQSLENMRARELSDGIAPATP